MVGFQFFTRYGKPPSDPRSDANSAQLGHLKARTPDGCCCPTRDLPAHQGPLSMSCLISLLFLIVFLSIHIMAIPKPSNGVITPAPRTADAHGSELIRTSPSDIGKDLQWILETQNVPRDLAGKRGWIWNNYVTYWVKEKDSGHETQASKDEVIGFDDRAAIAADEEEEQEIEQVADGDDEFWEEHLEDSGAADDYGQGNSG